MKVDYLIAGRGIAGSSLAIALIKAGKTVCCIDNPDLSASSRIAAGLFNPVVFKRTTLSWRAKESIAIAEKFYTDLERETGLNFFYPSGLYRIFGTPFEAEQWKKLMDEDSFKGILGSLEEISSRPWLNQPFGGAKINGAGYVDTSTFMQAARLFIDKNAEIRNETFLPQEIVLNPGNIQYNNIQANKVIFCEGFLAEQNPWFSTLPFKSAKGEVLVIFSPALPEDESFSGNIYVVPMGKGYFKVGATYAWEQKDQHPTPEKYNFLEEKLRNTIRVPFNITGHFAGIRPTVSDRRPLIGFHPENRNIGIFNGLGTKGVLLAPMLASEFTACLINNLPLPHEYSLERAWMK